MTTFADTGSYQITLKTTSQFGVDSSTQTVRIQSCNTANAPAFEQLGLSVVPNPNEGMFQLRMAGKLTGWYRVELQDLQEKRLLEKSFRDQGDRSVQEFDVRQLGGGLYFLRVGDGKGFVVRKVVLR